MILDGGVPQYLVPFIQVYVFLYVYLHGWGGGGRAGVRVLVDVCNGRYSVPIRFPWWWLLPDNSRSEYKIVGGDPSRVPLACLCSPGRYRWLRQVMKEGIVVTKMLHGKYVQIWNE